MKWLNPFIAKPTEPTTPVVEHIEKEHTSAAAELKRALFDLHKTFDVAFTQLDITPKKGTGDGD